MSQHAEPRALPNRLVAVWRDVVSWHDARRKASLDDARGWLWVVLVAAVFFLMSNPLVFIPTFYESLDRAVLLTEIVVVLSLPWLRLPRVPWPWAAFLALCLLSQLWTINDIHTDISADTYLKVSAIAFVIAANCQPVVVAWGLALGGVSVMVLSVQAYLQEMPGASAAAVGGATFTGVGTNENILAYTLVVSLAATLALARRRPVGAQLLWLFVLLINLWGLYLAQSGSGFMTAIAIALAVLALVAWPRVRAARRRHSWALAAGIGGAVLVAGASVLVVLNIRLSTFSGRAPLWRAAFDSTWDKAPLAGSGWGAVWEHPWDPTPPNAVASRHLHARRLRPVPRPQLLRGRAARAGSARRALAVVMICYAIRVVRRTGLHAPSRDPLAGRLLLLVLVALLVFGIPSPC